MHQAVDITEQAGARITRRWPRPKQRPIAEVVTFVEKGRLPKHERRSPLSKLAPRLHDEFVRRAGFASHLGSIDLDVDARGRYVARVHGETYDVDLEARQYQEKRLRDAEEEQQIKREREAKVAAERQSFHDENRLRLDEQRAADRECKQRDRRRMRDSAILSAGGLLAQGNLDAAGLLADQHGFELPRSVEQERAVRHEQLRAAAAGAGAPMYGPATAARPAGVQRKLYDMGLAAAMAEGVADRQDDIAAAEAIFQAGPTGTWTPAAPATVIDGSTEWAPKRPETSPPAKKTASTVILGTIDLDEAAKAAIQQLEDSVKALIESQKPRVGPSEAVGRAEEPSLTEKTASAKRRIDEEQLGKEALDPIEVAYAGLSAIQGQGKGEVYVAKLESGIRIEQKDGESLTDFFHRAWLAATSPVVSA